MKTLFCAKSYFSALVRYAVAAFVCFGVMHFSSADDVVSGKFNLIDHRGNPVTESSYKGKLRLVFFGFTNCPLVCPTTMADVAQVMRLLGEQGKQVQPLFISIDPANDTVSQLADYVGAFNASIVGLTGSAKQIEQAAKGYNVSYGRAAVIDMEGKSEIFHSTYLYLMGVDGEFIDLFGYGTRPQRIIEKLRQHLQG